MFVCGICWWRPSALMAPLLQSVMGYPIIDAGLLLGTRGVGMGICHAGGRPADERCRSARPAGHRPLAVALSRFTTRSTSHPTRRRTRSCGPACCRVSGWAPCSCRSTRWRLSTLPATLRTQGTAMWTLIRNLGSSIGVSIVIANLTNKTIMMHARLTESVTPVQPGDGRSGRGDARSLDGPGPRAAGEPRHPAGDDHRLRQRLQADDDR